MNIGLFDIETLRKRDDPAVAYRYNLIVPVPSGRQLNIDPMYIEDVQFQLPYHQQDTLVYNSTVIHYAGRLQVPPLTVRFYETFKYQIAEIIAVWMSLIRNNDGSLNYGVDYKRTITLYVFDGLNNPTASYNFLGCFPLESSPTQLSYSSPGRVTFTQTFSVDSVAQTFKRDNE